MPADWRWTRAMTAELSAPCAVDPLAFPHPPPELPEATKREVTAALDATKALLDKAKGEASKGEA
eukprot:CAMPEP_0172628994 /NCGR_PEP_ID=MMETSP1068-20121228/164948_1 /TAXON_ID=35684 /ORGANISM="Pseudopedinella elastica, Strain CCMP716" /LENGTH=64 /DNA_ID=CAMNT_0013439395 /DNA_START=14 /DNA_END=205 /DNA_ORIENTATION=-